MEFSKNIRNLSNRIDANGRMIALAVWLCVSFIFVQNSGAGNLYALLHVEKPVSAWSDSDFAAKLLDRLSGYRGVEFEVIADSNWQTSPSATNYVSSDYLAKVGAEYRARYVIVLENVTEELETRKGLSIPLLLSRYSEVAVLRGTLRIIDSEKGRMVVQKDFEVTLKSKSSWQALDDDPNVSGLRTAASEKQRLFSNLEWRAADKLANEILKKMKLK